jgi:hypothetical protein
VGIEPGVHTSVVVSPLDGALAWACSSAGSGRFAIWALHDGGAWIQVSALTPDTPETSYWCDLVADQGDAHSLVAQFSSGAGASGTLRTKSYLSTDAGTHWRAVPGLMQVMNVGTSGGSTYALMLDTTAGDREKPALVLSNDSLHSWRMIRPPDLTAGDSFFDFWLDPLSGAFVRGRLSGGVCPGAFVAPTYNATLWQASAGGALWTRIATPGGQTSVGAWLPQRQQWVFCGGNACSHDLGATWTITPALSDTYSCANCGKNGAPETNTVGCGPSMIAANGAFLTVCGQTTSVLYILRPNAATWTRLGTAPCIFDHITATSHVWCFMSPGGADAFAIAPLPA